MWDGDPLVLIDTAERIESSLIAQKLAIGVGERYDDGPPLVEVVNTLEKVRVTNPRLFNILKLTYAGNKVLEDRARDFAGFPQQH